MVLSIGSEGPGHDLYADGISASGYATSNGGQEKFNKTLIEALRTYVSHRHDNWDECLLYFEFAYNNSVNPSTGMSPFILSYSQSPHAPW